MKSAIIVLCIGLFAAWPLHAAVPSFVTYSGRLTDGTGWGESTAVDLTVRIYPQEAGGAAVWEQSYPAQPLEDGYLTVLLGNVTAVFSQHDETWIALVVEGVELVPRQRIGAVPYAVRADRVEAGGAGSRLSSNGVFRGTTCGKSICTGGLPGCSFDGTGKTKGAIAVTGYAMGYRSGKKACEKALGDSPTAHLCSMQELVESAQMGIFIPGDASLWASSGVFSSSWDVAAAKDWSVADCYGWQTGVDQAGNGTWCKGSAWFVPGRYPTMNACGTASCLACCDFPLE